MSAITSTQNWVQCEHAEELKAIHKTDRNIAIWKRSIDNLTEELKSLPTDGIQIRVIGDIETILVTTTNVLNHRSHGALVEDINHLLEVFESVSGAKKFKVFLGTVYTDMCRRFHYDMNDLRLLCTYSGPGTLWLTEDNLNRCALENLEGNESIVPDFSEIRQVETGHVAILKGGRYRGKKTKAVVHRSPTIEEGGGARLLLRIDTNEL